MGNGGLFLTSVKIFSFALRLSTHSFLEHFSGLGTMTRGISSGLIFFLGCISNRPSEEPTAIGPYNTSKGNSTKTGPGTPEAASWKASRTTGTKSRTARTLQAFLTIGAITDIWSMSCKAPRPWDRDGAAPPISTTGDCANAQFCTAVMVFVTPGPAVTRATPGTPVSRATASAANIAVTSCRTSATLMPNCSQPTSKGEMCPPTRVKTCFTPWAAMTFATSIPTFRESNLRSPKRPW
mmetsp:Transcript_683/g.1505  ORF Transcript_683/g.1505 Transcript_683/m.1505 type:complete len:238 (-) Transcript_683:129-842(-)